MNYNRSQQKAIKHKDGPMMVLAGPGSGKTAVIIERLRFLIEQQRTPADQILVVTFSKAAAEEMKNRFFNARDQRGRKNKKDMQHRNAAAGPQNGPIVQPNENLGSGSVVFGTMHSVFYRILQESGNYDSLNIITTSKKFELLKTEVLKYFPEAEEELLGKILDEISYLKNSQLNPDAYEAHTVQGDLFRKIYQAFQTEVRCRHLIDFDDILLLCLQLLQNNPKILSQWQKRFTYVLVDEFQDINLVQYKILCLLTAKSHNLFVVGDDDQSIYGFRGAQPQIIRQFLKNHRQANRILLDINYRCGKKILKRALQLISVNRNRIDKRILAGKQEQGYFQLANYKTQEAEFDSIACKIQELEKKGVSLSEMAILFRNTFDAESMTHMLAVRNIPFRLQEPITNLFTTFIALDLTAFMRAASGCCSRADFLRIMNKPSRYISRDAITSTTSGQVQHYLQGCASFYKGNPKMQERIQELASHLQFLSGCTPFSAICYIRKVVGYDRYLEQYAKEVQRSLEKCTEQMAQIEESAKPFQSFAQWFAFIDQYSAALADSTGRKQTEANSISFSENNRLKQTHINFVLPAASTGLIQADTNSQKTAALMQSEKMKGDGINLMTMHASKGLEFNTVFLPSLNSGVIPHRKVATKEAVEEERRLLYVAMTRAKDRLYMSYADVIRNKHTQPSVFLESIL